jgi:leucyl aminopeptidase
MLELSTLTGAITIALGKQRAGLFTNSTSLVQEIIKTGEEVEELGWHMPIDEYHEDLIKSKQADITNASKQPEGSSCQAAAFLKNFVEPGVEWAHIDIAAVSEEGSFSTGYGAKLLIHLLKKRSV